MRHPVIPLRKDSLVLQRTHWFVCTFVRNAARFFITWAGALPVLAGGKIVIVEHSASSFASSDFGPTQDTAMVAAKNLRYVDDQRPGIARETS